MRDHFLPFAFPDLDASELHEISEVLESGWITTGPKALRFEAEFASAVEARYAVAVNSGTAALHLSLEALGLQPGDEVITTTYTFAATAEVVGYFKAKPVLVDVEPDSLNLNPQLIEPAITERTKAIIPVHIAGFPANLEHLHEIAAAYHLGVIEDAAHAFPAKYQGRFIGSGVPASSGEQPHCTCFSFYATKTITTGEGGMICTDNQELARRCRMMALHGISHDAWKRYAQEGSWYYEIMAAGYKYNLTDLAAALGLAQLAKAERMRQRRVEIAERYHEVFRTVPQLQLPCDREDCQHAWHLYMLRLNLEQLQIDRMRFIEELKQRKIGASVHFIPLHLHPYYQETYGYQPEAFPVAYQEYLREVSLPIYSKMTDADILDVIESVLDIVKCYAR